MQEPRLKNDVEWAVALGLTGVFWHLRIMEKGCGHKAGQKAAAQARDERLKQRLRENLHKRKQKARARAAAHEGDTSVGLSVEAMQKDVK